MLNHSNDETTIAINLNHFVQLAMERKQQIPTLSDLKQHLKISKIRKYIGQKQCHHAFGTTRTTINRRRFDAGCLRKRFENVHQTTCRICCGNLCAKIARRSAICAKHGTDSIQRNRCTGCQTGF